MQRITISIIFLVTLFMISACDHKSAGPVNVLPDLISCDSEIMIRNWDLTATDTVESYDVYQIKNTNKPHVTDQGDHLNNYNSFIRLYDQKVEKNGLIASTPLARFSYHINGSYMPLEDIYQTSDIPIGVYAASVINSQVEQDVAFVIGANNGIQFWVNGKLQLENYTEQFLNGYQYLIKVHLTKGNNFILARLDHMTDQWRFFLKICSIHYANENSIGKNYASICENYILKKGDPICLKIWSPFIYTNQLATASLTDMDKHTIFKKTLLCNYGTNTIISTNGIKDGIYKINLSTDSSQFQQYIFIGNYRAYYANIAARLKKLKKDYSERNTAKMIVERFNYLDTVNIPHDNGFERKITDNLFALTTIYERLQKGQYCFKNQPGLYLRSQKDSVYAADGYMIYMPKSYNSNRPIPLVVMLPVQTGLRHFNISSYVANIDNLEHLQRLAEKYKFGIVWSNFKMYENYTLNRMVPEAIFRTISQVEEDYNIDKNRIYASGDCGGGAWAIFLGNNYPGYYAALAMEGPAIPSLNEDAMPPKMLSAFDFFKRAQNLSNTPVLIMHSTSDKKCSYPLTQQFVNTVQKYSNKLIFKKLHTLKGKDLYFMDLMPENKILSDMFEFFKGKQLSIPDSLSFDCDELKYNRSFWISIKSKLNGPANIQAVLDRRKNKIVVNAINVIDYTIDLATIRNKFAAKAIEIITNGQTKVFATNTDRADISITSPSKSSLKKNSCSDGPINDFFTKPFILVCCTNGSKYENKMARKTAMQISNAWKSNFMDDSCRIEDDIDVTDEDMHSYNMLLLGTPKSNKLVEKFSRRLPLKIYSDSIRIKEHSYNGNAISFKMIYPNPDQEGKYLLIIGTNGKAIDIGNCQDLFFFNWYDYEIVRNRFVLASGYFDQNWQ